MTESKNAIFLSYASEDAAPAQRLCATLRAAGIEVWFDQSELRGGDAWDQKIRREIRGCALFMPVISANTQGRLEGYFRREWKLAAARTHDMADDKPFLVPVVIDDTKSQDAHVPEQFRSVQWTSIRAGEITADFVERVRHLLLPNSTAATQIRAESGASFTPRMQSAPAPRPIPDKSIAVLPFADISAQKDQEYFSDGLAEALIDLLTQVRDLQVPARTSSFSFKGKSDDIATIAERLRVAHILEGSVRKAGSTVRVTAHLIRADDGYHLWSKTYDRDIEDIFKVQDEIARIVVEALKAKLLPPEGVVNPHRTSNTEAYEHYLLAKYFYNRGAIHDSQAAASALQQALALDPSYAAAHALLAVNISQRIATGGDRARVNREEAIAAAEQAVALAPGLAEAYSARSYIRTTLQWDWSGAQTDIQKALKLDPRSDGTQRRYAILLASIARLPEAIAAVLEATKIEPLDVNAWILLGWFYYAAGQFSPANRALSHALELNPQSTLAILILAQNELAAGKTAEAQEINGRQQIEQWRWCIQVIIEYCLSHAQESQRILNELIEKYGQSSPNLIAIAYAWRGEMDSTFDWLERAYLQRDPPLGLIQFHIGILSGLSRDPRYKLLLRKMNFPD